MRLPPDIDYQDSDENRKQRKIVRLSERYLSMILILPLVLLLDFGFGGNTLSGLSWLQGEWQSENNQSITSEIWYKVSDSTYEGFGKTLSKTDSALINHESLRLVVMSGNIYYIAKVGHNALPVAFRLSRLSDSLAVFDNPDHDFPNRIAYHLQVNNCMLVEVSSADKSFTILFRKRMRR